LRTIYTPVAGGRNNYFCHSDFVAADVSPLISGRGKIGADSRRLPHHGKNHQKRGFLPARIERPPHKRENGRTGGKLARTKREIVRTGREIAARTGKRAPGWEDCRTEMEIGRTD
jgi:hypothetical protein